MDTVARIDRTVHRFSDALAINQRQGIFRASLRELQLNLGKLCNQACNHCHVDAGPKRTEIMDRQTMDRILIWAKKNNLGSVDITGGAPEMNPYFRFLVDQFLQMDWSVTSRCNLTILTEPGYDDLAQWYAERKIRLVASLPCYSEKNVDEQRGKGVFGKSIQALQTLNALGYGKSPDLVLDLVYNPGGAFLPPSQASLEADYRKILEESSGIQFTNLLTLANLPVSRFLHFLERTGQTNNYYQLLSEKYNDATIDGLMCRHLVSVDWQGRIFDCDFNQMLGLAMTTTKSAPIGQYLWETSMNSYKGLPVATGDHCLGCTAGAGSSCGGAISE